MQYLQYSNHIFVLSICYSLLFLTEASAKPLSYSQSQYHLDVNGKPQVMSIEGIDGIAGKSHWQRDLFGNVAQKKICIKQFDTTGEMISIESDCQLTNVDNLLALDADDGYYQGEVFNYNSANELTSVCNQKGQCETHDFYINGFKKSAKDIAGNAFHYDYDAAGHVIRLLAKDTKGNHYKKLYCYDVAKPAGECHDQDHLSSGSAIGKHTGRLLSIREYWNKALTSRIDYHYYADGKLAKLTYDRGQSHSQSVSWQYNDYEELLGQSDAMGHQLMYEYDQFGRAHRSCLYVDGKHNSGCDQAQHFMEYQYITDKHTLGYGKLASQYYSNDINKAFSYDGWGNTTEIRLCQGQNDCEQDDQQLLQQLNYHYDPITGNIIESSSYSPSAQVATNHTKSYHYNTLNQLVSSQIKSQGNTLLQNSYFVYDERANLLSEHQQLANGQKKLKQYQYNQLNQLLAMTHDDRYIERCQSPDQQGCILYDKDTGNMLRDGLGNAFSYNLLNQLIAVSNEYTKITTKNNYYANGLRSSKQVTIGDDVHQPLYYYYDHAQNANIINEWQAGSYTSYLLSGNERAFRVYHQVDNQSNLQATAQYLLYGFKDVLSVLNADMTMAKSYNYSDYGENVKLANLLATKHDKPQNDKVKMLSQPEALLVQNPFQHSGEYRDIENDLDYLRARFYHPQLKVFAARDSKPLLNRYHYTGGNPIMMIDPSGHEAFPAWASQLVGGSAFSFVFGLAFGPLGSVVGDVAWQALYDTVLDSKRNQGVMLDVGMSIAGAAIGGLGSYGITNIMANNSGRNFSAMKPIWAMKQSPSFPAYDAKYQFDNYTCGAYATKNYLKAKGISKAEYEGLKLTKLEDRTYYNMLEERAAGNLPKVGDWFTVMSDGKVRMMQADTFRAAVVKPNGNGELVGFTDIVDKYFRANQDSKQMNMIILNDKHWFHAVIDGNRRVTINDSIIGRSRSNVSLDRVLNRFNGTTIYMDMEGK